MILCRLCLANDTTTSFVTNITTIEAILKKFFIVFTKPDLSDANDQKILSQLCVPCWTRINDFNQFYTNTETIHVAYTQHFINEDGTYISFDSTDEYFIHTENIHDEYNKYRNDDEKKMPTLEPFCIINIDETDSSKAEMDDAKLKAESVEVDNLEGIDSDSDYMKTADDDYNIEDIEDSDTSSDESYVEPKPRRSKTSFTTTANANLTSNRTRKAKDQRSLPRRISKQCTVTVNVVDEDNKRLLQYVQMRCDICIEDQLFTSFSDVKTHYMQSHNQRGYVICCNRKFRRIGRILQHCAWHDNPEAFKCDTCKKCFQDNVCLRDHVTSMHIPVDERQFQCDQCSRLFAKQHLLNTHLKMKHTIKEERPFVCQENECGQRFVLPAYLRMHIEKVHNKSDSRVCDVCARFFKCSKSYERHYQIEHSNVDQRVQCDLCQKWFKHLDTLKDHIRRHYASTEKCKYCGRVSTNKKSLRLHIRNVHADIDETVKTRNEFPCTICKKIFKKKQTLREHMTLHTGEAYLYTCTFCSKTFRSSANMYAHRKRNHPREYEEKCMLGKMQKS